MCGGTRLANVTRRSSYLKGKAHTAKLRKKGRPPYLPPPRKGRRKQSVYAGLVYEKNLSNYLTSLFGEDKVIHGPWIEYEDDQGYGVCQPDIVVLNEGEEASLLVEAKLTYTKRAARLKLKKLYLPLVQLVWPDREWIMVQACKNINQHARKYAFTKGIQTVRKQKPGSYITWQWRPL